MNSLKSKKLFLSLLGKRKTTSALKTQNQIDNIPINNDEKSL